MDKISFEIHSGPISKRKSFLANSTFGFAKFQIVLQIMRNICLPSFVMAKSRHYVTDVQWPLEISWSTQSAMNG